MAKLKYRDEVTGEWIEIAVSPDEFNAYTIATDASLDTKATKQEVDNLKGSVEFADVRLITFVVNAEVIDGIQSAHIPFLFDGDIEEMNAYCSKRGARDAYIRIEKSEDMQTWNSITTNQMTIREGNYFDDKNHILFNRSVKKGDIFRVNVEESGEISNLTVNIRIKIRNFSSPFMF